MVPHKVKLSMRTAVYMKTKKRDQNLEDIERFTVTDFKEVVN
jgi:hypothetical protein